MTATSHADAATPVFPTLKHDPFFGVLDDEFESTPVALEPVPPALRDACIRFAERLEPIHNLEVIKVAVGGDLPRRTLFSSAPVSGRVVVVRVGTASELDADMSDALVVFEQIQRELAVTQKDLLTATGIKRRTFYSWKDPSSPRPRPSSVGRLWHLADTLIDIRETLRRPVGAWLHASPERIKALKQGNFEHLLDLAVAMPARSIKEEGTSDRLGVVADVELPVVKSGKPKVAIVERGSKR